MGHVVSKLNFKNVYINISPTSLFVHEDGTKTTFEIEGMKPGFFINVDIEMLQEDKEDIT